jgi:hypothetical protein
VTTLLKTQNKIANIFVILSFGISILSLVYFGFDWSKPVLSRAVQCGIISQDGTLISNSPEALVVRGGVDPIDLVLGRSNPIFNSAFYSPAGQRTSAHWRTPLDARKIAEVFLCRGVNGNQLSEKLNGVTKFLSNDIELPIVSLMVESKSFFDAREGIYVQGERWHESLSSNLFQPWFMKAGNYSLRGRNAVKSGYVQFFDKGREVYYSGAVEIKIHGNATRSFPQKSLRLIAKESLIENPWGKKVESLILRNGGNTWETTLIGDVIAQTVLENSDLMIQRGQPCVLLLNGFYWGIHNIRDRIKASNLAIRFKCSLEDISIWEDWELDFGNPKRSVDLSDLLKRISNDERISYKELKKELDIGEFAEYIFAEIFLGNTDWPTNNFAMYKVRKSKWHPIVSDLDFSLGYNRLIEPNENGFKRLLSTYSVCQLLFKELLKHKEFKEVMLNTYSKYQEIGIFDANVFKALVKKISGNVEEELPRHILRWRKIESIDNWKNNIEEMEIFYEARIVHFKTSFEQLLRNEKFFR